MGITGHIPGDGLQLSGELHLISWQLSWTKTVSGSLLVVQSHEPYNFCLNWLEQTSDFW